MRARPIVLRGAPIGRWVAISWDPQRFLVPYAEDFVRELLAHARKGYPGRALTRGAPSLPRPGD